MHKKSMKYANSYQKYAKKICITSKCSIMITVKNIRQSK